MRIYDTENSVRRILEDVQSTAPTGHVQSVGSASQVTAIDINALNKRLSNIDPQAIQRSRTRYNLFYQEVMVSADPENGISFTSVMMILAHYNIINDNKSLKLDEFLRRRARLHRVEEEVRRRVVIGFFDTLYWSRKFKAHIAKKKAGRLTAIPQLGPEVYIDEEGDFTDAPKRTPTLSPIDKENSHTAFMNYGLDGASQARARRGTGSSILVGPLSPGHQLSPNRATATGFSLENGGDSGGNSASSSRRGSSVSAENVLEVLDNSAWGESIRRSFTMRRPSRGD